MKKLGNTEKVISDLRHSGPWFEMKKVITDPGKEPRALLLVGLVGFEKSDPFSPHVLEKICMVGSTEAQKHECLFLREIPV